MHIVIEIRAVDLYQSPVRTVPSFLHRLTARYLPLNPFPSHKSPFPTFVRDSCPLLPSQSLHPRNLAPKLTDTHWSPGLLIIIIPPALPLFIQVKLERLPALVADALPPPPKMKGSELQPSAVKSHEVRKLGVRVGIGKGSRGFGVGGRDEGGCVFFLGEGQRGDAGWLDCEVERRRWSGVESFNLERGREMEEEVGP